MGTSVGGPALLVGDVIWDRNVDSHPCVVMAKDAYYIYMRNCTSHAAEHLGTLLIAAADKTGDGSWSGKDSYLVTKSTQLTMQTGSLQQAYDYNNMVPVQVPSGPPVLQWYQGPDGAPACCYVQPTQTMLAPSMVSQFVPIMYNKVGTVSATRIASLLTEIG